MWQRRTVKIRRLIDLSLPLGPQTQMYPGDPAPRTRSAATVSVDGYATSTVTMGSHSGTHVDAPCHVTPSGRPIDTVDLALFAGTAVVVPLTELPPRTPITPEHLGAVIDLLTPDAIVLLHTGWSRHYGTAEYFDHPYLAPEACRELLDHGVRAIGIDAPSIDPSPGTTTGSEDLSVDRRGTPTGAAPDAPPPQESPAPGDEAGVGAADLPAHRLVAEADGVIIENLCRLDQLDFAEPFVTVFPLPWAAADGSPVRAVAMDLLP